MSGSSRPRAAPAPLDQLNPSRVCLIKPSALGDVVQTMPVLAGLRDRWPQAHISWVVNRSLGEVLCGHPALDELIAFDRTARGMRRFSSALRLARRLWQGEFDLVIDLQGLLRSGVMTWLTRAERRVGFAEAREGSLWAYTDAVSVPTPNMPAVDRYWLVAQQFGCQGPPPSAGVPVTTDHQSWAQRTLAGLPRPLLAIHPGAQWETKRWPLDHFATVARRAMEQFGAGIVLLGGPSDAALCAGLAARLDDKPLNLGAQTTLLELAAVSAEADVFLSGDTGPMHLAAAMGTPVVAIYTCTSPRRAGPHGEGHRTVATSVPCAASYLKNCSSKICMQELAASKVWPSLESALSETAACRQQAG